MNSLTHSKSAPKIKRAPLAPLALLIKGKSQEGQLLHHSVENTSQSKTPPMAGSKGIATAKLVVGFQIQNEFDEEIGAPRLNPPRTTKTKMFLGYFLWDIRDI